MPVDGGHPISVVARRTGLTPEVIRVWEKRYGVVTPKRTRTGRRLYSLEDIERLRRVREATLSGRRVGEVSRLSTDALRALAIEDEREMRMAPSPPSATSASRSVDPHEPTAAPMVEEAMVAVRDLDAPRLEETLNRALLLLGAEGFIDRTVILLLRVIGESWHEGRLGVPNEHLATVVVREVCLQVMARGRPDPSTPAVLVTTLPGQRHELGAILAACVAQMSGWRVVYLGADLPAREVARAAEHAWADIVALSLVYPADDPVISSELTELRKLLPEQTAIVVGGAAAPGYRRALKKIGAELIEDMAGFRRRLAVRRQRPRRERSKVKASPPPPIGGVGAPWRPDPPAPSGARRGS